MQEKFPGLAACWEQFQDMANRAATFLGEKAAAVGTWAKANYEKISMAGHLVLDLAGFIPLVGAIPDVLNGLWYAAEGNRTDALLSLAAAVPGPGDVAAAVGKSGSYLAKGIKGADKARDAFNAVERLRYRVCRQR